MQSRFYLAGPLILFILLGLGSCKRNACDKISCENDAVCEAGSCNCKIGYEGSLCEVLTRAKFVKNGTYSVNEEGTSTPLSQYKATIVAGDQINQVKIQGLRDGIFQGQDVIATIYHDTIRIFNQTVNGYEIEGIGVIKDESLEPSSNIYDKASMRITYFTKRLSDNTIDYYGTNGTQPSDWSKD